MNDPEENELSAAESTPRERPSAAIFLVAVDLVACVASLPRRYLHQNVQRAGCIVALARGLGGGLCIGLYGSLSRAGIGVDGNQRGAVFRTQKRREQTRDNNQPITSLQSLPRLCLECFSLYRCSPA